jgi:hypothetical protein
MDQELTAQTRATAGASSRGARFMQIATDYFAYVGLLSVAVCVAVMTLAFSASIGIQVLDTVAKPGFLDGEIEAATPPSTPHKVRAVWLSQVAMVPAAALHAEQATGASNN